MLTENSRFFKSMITNILSTLLTGCMIWVWDVGGVGFMAKGGRKGGGGGRGKYTFHTNPGPRLEDLRW